MVGAEQAMLFYEQMGLVEEEFDWNGTNVEWCAEDLNNPFANLVVKKNDEHGCGRPTSLWDTPGWFNHGMGGHFKDGQEEEALADYRKICLERAKTAHKNDPNWTEKANGPLTKHYANLSVAIFFDKKPSEELCNLMINRAKAYVQEYRLTQEKYMSERMPSEIGGFRLLVEKMTQTEEKTWEA
jgi:hypothetical protein